MITEYTLINTKTIEIESKYRIIDPPRWGAYIRDASFFIKGTYITPLEDNLLRGAPSPSPAMKNSFKMLPKGVCRFSS